MGYYFTGYSLYTTSPTRMRELFENAYLRRPGMFYERHFKPENFSADYESTKKKVFSAFESGEKGLKLTPPECAVIFDLLSAMSEVRGLSVALEVGRQVKPFLQKWMPIVLDKPAIADQMMTGGAWGLKGTAPFEFGHLTLKDLSVHNWEDYVGFLEKFTPEQMSEITEDYSIGDLLTDTMALSFEQAARALRSELSEDDGALIFLVPHYIDLTYDEDEANSDIPRGAVLG